MNLQQIHAREQGKKHQVADEEHSVNHLNQEVMKMNYLDTISYFVPAEFVK